MSTSLLIPLAVCALIWIAVVAVLIEIATRDAQDEHS